jgi:integrase
MASQYQRNDRKKNKYVVRYKDPVSGSWKSESYSTQGKADEAEQKWNLIETWRKNGNPQWKSLYHQVDEVITIQDVFDAYEHNVLANKTNELTCIRYKSVMKSALEVFPPETPVESIRGMYRDMKTGRKQGWEIYKAYRDHFCTRNGINSYLRDLRCIFMWALTNGGAQGRGMVHFEVVTKNDKYSPSEVEDIQIKIWQDEEIMTLFNHPSISEFQHDLLTVYLYTGARAKELLGFNYRNRKKELQWHHIDFNERTISLLPKRKKSRKLAKQHPIVMDILRKWKNEGKEKPLPFAYKKLCRIFHDINSVTGIKFTCHDLRRLKAQLAEEENGDIQLAGYAIGDTTQSVVSKHYAPVSHTTMDKINDSVDNAFNRKMGVA